MKQRLVMVLLIVVVGVGALARTPRAAYAVDVLCFDNPDITNCISATFRTFWEEAGGLARFGYPLTPERIEATSGGVYTVQYFERARFEYHPENPPAYQVQLGRLGAELYEPLFNIPDAPALGCRYFAETGYNVCEPFLSVWQAPGDVPGRSSIDLFGLPLSPIILETNAIGLPITVQWFERARFELHGGNTVLLGLLGREALAPPPEIPLPEPPQPGPIPIPEPEPLPEAPAPPPPLQAPFPDKPCDVNVPDPIEGFQVWATIPEVAPPFDEVICGRLIVDGQPAFAAFMQAFRYTPEGVRPTLIHTTGFDGVTGFIFYVGDLPADTTVPVEVVATYQGREYRKWTSFIRR